MCRIRLHDGAVDTLGVDKQIGIIPILDAGYRFPQAGGVFGVGPVFLQVSLKGRQIVFVGFQIVQRVDHVVDDIFLIDRIVCMVAGGLGIPHKGGHQGADVHMGGLQRQRVRRQGVLLNLFDIGRGALGNRIDQRNADNADAARKAGQSRAALFGKQVFQRQPEGGKQRHGRALFPALGSDLFLLCGRFLRQLCLRQRSGIPGDLPIQHADDAGGIPLGQLRVVGHHHHQPILGHLFEQLHHLHAGFGIQRSRRFIRQNNVRVIHQRPGNGHPLHLSAGHFAGLFSQLRAQPHLLQRLLGPAPALRLGYAGEGQRQLHILQHGLVGNEVVALEYKADGVVAVGVPVPAAEGPGGFAVDDQVAAGVLIQTADDVQQGGFPAAGGPQNGDKFVAAKIQRHTTQGGDGVFPRRIGFYNIFQLQHRRFLS